MLSEYGYKIYQNVGNSDYTIDIAIEHPEYENCFVAGIECDGESYHMARTVRDREHLRTAVLEQMGWKMYRIWSTEWINNFEGEKARLLAFIKDAIKTYQKQEQRDECEVPVQEENVAVEEIAKEELNRVVDKRNPYDFEKYRYANWYDAPQEGLYDDASKIAAMITYIVGIEQPIHIELLYRRMAGAFGNEKATKPVRNYVDYVIGKKLQGQIKIVEDFVIMSGFKEIKVRMMSGIFNRDVKYIPKQEIAKAMLAIITNSFGIERKQLILETARIFGFERTGNKIVDYMNLAIDFLVEKGKIRILDEKIQLLEE